MKNQSEFRFSKQVVSFFQNKLSRDKFSGIKVEPTVQILKDFTIGRHNGAWKSVLGVQQQDVVFYKDSLDWQHFGNEAYITNQGTKKVLVPLLICELKVARSMNTHAFITYSRIAEGIKDIFPHCAYYFILNSNKERGLLPETLLRQSKGFDRVFLEWNLEKETIWHDIRSHFDYLKRIGIITDN